MAIGISASHGSGSVGMNQTGPAAKPDDMGTLGNVKFRPKGGGATKARERLQSIWNRLTSSVKSTSVRLVSFFTGGASRTHPAKSDGGLNANKHAGLTKDDISRPTTLPETPAGRGPYSTNSALWDFPPGTGSPVYENLQPSGRSLLATPDSKSLADASIADNTESRPLSEAPTSPVSLKSQQSDTSPLARPVSLGLADVPSSPADEDPARVDEQASSSNTNSSSSDEESLPSSVKLRTRTSSKESGGESASAAESRAFKSKSTIDGRVPRKAADQSDSMALQAKNTVLQAQNAFLKDKLAQAEANKANAPQGNTAAPPAPVSVGAPPPPPPPPPGLIPVGKNAGQGAGLFSAEELQNAAQTLNRTAPAEKNAAETDVQDQLKQELVKKLEERKNKPQTEQAASLDKIGSAFKASSSGDEASGVDTNFPRLRKTANTPPAPRPKSKVGELFAKLARQFEKTEAR